MKELRLTANISTAELMIRAPRAGDRCTGLACGPARSADETDTGEGRLGWLGGSGFGHPLRLAGFPALQCSGLLVSVKMVGGRW